MGEDSPLRAHTATRQLPRKTLLGRRLPSVSILRGKGARGLLTSTRGQTVERDAARTDGAAKRGCRGSTSLCKLCSRLADFRWPCGRLIVAAGSHAR